MRKVSLCWFRKCLRMHDNPALTQTINMDNLKKNYILPFFIIDPEFKILPSETDYSDNTLQISSGATFFCSHNRYHFLYESLKDLDKNLNSVGLKLYLFYGKPKKVFEFLYQNLSEKTNINKNFNIETNKEDIQIELNFEFGLKNVLNFFRHRTIFSS
jgi:deoxyribodipyrimidine photo-lyase